MRQARCSDCPSQSSDLTLAWVVLCQVSEEQNDTAVLLALLSGCNTTTEIVELLETVEGPYAFVYWQVRLSRGMLIVVMACLLKLPLLLRQATSGCSSARTNWAVVACYFIDHRRAQNPSFSPP